MCLLLSRTREEIVGASLSAFMPPGANGGLTGNRSVPERKGHMAGRFPAA